VRTIQRKKPELVPLLHALLTNAPPEMTSDPNRAEVERASGCINRDDAPILAAPVASGADCLVSGNIRHFTVKAGRCEGIAILTPAGYLETLSPETRR
jgi:predicted nucleic acid-binding protein